MSGQIVLFGATGYTGRLVAGELADLGARPVLAGRDKERLTQLSHDLGGDFEVRTADVTDRRSVADLIEPGDVLVSTVGPFIRWGQPAAIAAVAKGVTYLDSTGEGSFIREMQERVGARADETGAALIPAFGYDYVPGNLAGAMALERAGKEATRLDVGYFAPGPTAMSGGTAATSVGMMLAPSYRFHDGALVVDRQGARTRTFEIDGKAHAGLAVGSSEHLFLPSLAPGLRDIGVYLGWFGAISRLAPVNAAVGRGVSAIPGAVSMLSRAATRFRGSGGGPDAQTRSRSTSLVVAEAHDSAGQLLARVDLVGPNGYTLTGLLLAWGATAALAGKVHGKGVLGPVEAFGLDELQAACAKLGLVESATQD